MTEPTVASTPNRDASTSTSIRPAETSTCWAQRDQA